MSEQDFEDLAVEAHLLDAIDNQLADDNPPYVNDILQGLLAQGITEKNAKALMAVVLADEIHCVLTEQRAFDSPRYERLLRELPELPASVRDEEE